MSVTTYEKDVNYIIKLIRKEKSTFCVIYIYI